MSLQEIMQNQEEIRMTAKNVSSWDPLSVQVFCGKD
jgi:hypothetical protein